MTILLIEDEPKLSYVLKKTLELERYVVESAADGVEGLQKALTADYDLIILDLMLPRKDGMEVCREIRTRHLPVPILILTARDKIEDRVRGLDCGADDYLVKPFDFEELLARIRSVLRRHRVPVDTKLTVGTLVLDPATHEVRQEGKLISLTPKEYALLEYLMRSPNYVLTRDQLLDHVWGPQHHPMGNQLDVYMRYLRRKLNDDDKNLLVTVRRTGYKLVPPRD